MHDVLAGRRALVLGGAGFIGQWVTRALSHAGAGVHVVVRDRARAEQILERHAVTAEIIEEDLGRPQALPGLVRSVRPAVTFNLAVYGVDRGERDKSTAHAMNAELVSALCRAVDEYSDPDWSGYRLIHAGSAFEYGSAGGDLREDSLAKPVTAYGQSKLAGTQALQHHASRRGLRAVVARLFTVYGPGEHEGRLLPALRRAAELDEPVRLTSGSQERDFTYVEDVAEGLLRIGVSAGAKGLIVNLASGKLIAVRQFVETAARLLAIPPSHLVYGSLEEVGEEMSHEPVNLERLRTLINWTPTSSVEQGISRTIDFERSVQQSHQTPLTTLPRPSSRRVPH
jgi:nucleoside-diphosphate-sugar epimerase